jgi:hypothetical protein
VVFITLDGVRWEEFFNGADPLLAPAAPAFPIFWQRIAPRGTVYGNLGAGSEMKVSNGANASLPGYTSIFAETPQGCETNWCGRISVPTFPDRLKDELQIPQAQLAVFAAWPKLSLAVSSRDDVATVHAGEPEPAGTPQALTDDSFEMDRSPVLEGLRYWQQSRPRFFYLSLLDSDRYGHQGDYPRYLKVLGAYDRLISDIADQLDGNTALIISTDHGRGAWDQWTDHGPHVPASSDVWAFVMVPAGLKLRDPLESTFTHDDLRYSIETLFGLGTTSSSGFSTGFLAQ